MVLLYEGGLELKEIKEQMGVSSNFVYNVISEYCRMNDVELRVVKKVKSGVGKDEIEKLLLEGKEVVEISGMLKVRSNYIYKIRKELRTQGVVSAEIIKNRVTRQFVVPTHLLRMGEIERERLRIRSREINSTSTYRQSQYFQKYLTDYLASLGKKDIAFEEITEDFGKNYKAFLIRNKNFSTSQTNRCLCWLNRLLYLAVDNEILRTNPVENVEYEKKTAPTVSQLLANSTMSKAGSS
jgi:transposase